MTLIFLDNDFKYELEAVVKLFFPAELFKLVYGKKPETVIGDYCLFNRVVENATATLTVECSINGKTVCNNKTLKVDSPSYQGDCEVEFGRLLFNILSDLTGKSVGWGILTGVRPVKRVNKMLLEGRTKKEIFTELKDKYLCSQEKCDIAFKTAIAQKNILDTLDDKTFSLYVSIPFCPSRCSYCSFVSQEVEKSLKLIPQYVKNLCLEIQELGKLVEKLELKLDTIYFGGGTPTSIDARYINLIMKSIEDSFDVSNLREYTVEAGRADTITKEKLEVIKNNGATRISINPQTLNNDVLKAIGRRHTSKDFYDKFHMAREMGFDSINTDLIAGLPTDTIESFKNTINSIIDLSPENITVHTLSIKRTSNLNIENNRDVLKNPVCEMVEYATKTLLEKGYLPYYLYKQKNMLDNLENIGWAKRGHESLYNIFIMEEKQTILAVGAGGSTKLVDLKNSKIERVYNYKLPLEYIRRFDIMLERKSEIERFYGFE